MGSCMATSCCSSQGLILRRGSLSCGRNSLLSELLVNLRRLIAALLRWKTFVRRQGTTVEHGKRRTDRRYLERNLRRRTSLVCLK
jgi:hypothetical protein